METGLCFEFGNTRKVCLYYELLKWCKNYWCFDLKSAMQKMRLESVDKY